MKKEQAKFAIPVMALVLIASVVTGRERPPEAQAEPAARIDARVQVPDADFDVASIKREPRAEEGAPQRPDANPFARRSFSGEQPAGPAAAPQAPSAPALPFTYLGKVIEDGRLNVFLGKGDESYSVSKPKKLDDEYRVDKVTESRITFTHIPTKTKQTLDIPAVN